jgi:hypothetical protein
MEINETMSDELRAILRQIADDMGGGFEQVVSQLLREGVFECSISARATEMMLEYDQS